MTKANLRKCYVDYSIGNDVYRTHYLFHEWSSERDRPVAILETLEGTVEVRGVKGLHFCDEFPTPPKHVTVSRMVHIALDNYQQVDA